MTKHDIIDNRSEKLVDHLKTILASTDSAKFAVGYFFMSGLDSVADKLSNMKELRLLIGNTTNQQTIEQMAEGYRRLDMVTKAAEAQQFRKRSETREMVSETAQHLRGEMEMMDQTDEAQCLVVTLARMIEEGRLKVRVYTKGRLHAKAYICDYTTLYDASGKAVTRHEKGIAIVGSSNFTLSGVANNTELNVVVNGNENHQALTEWFDELWAESEDFNEALMQEMQKSWAIEELKPYDIYMKTLYTLVKDRVEGAGPQDLLWDDEITSKLADFQKVAVRQAVQIIRDNDGGFVADVVGLGKSYIGAAIVKHFERAEHARPLIICPASLTDMWDRYNERYELNARVLSMGMLSDPKNITKYLDPVNGLYRDRNFVLIDESHNFRYPDTQRYKAVQRFLETGRKRCCFLSATPRNKSAYDVYYQTKLFHPEDVTDIPIDPPNIREYFKLIEQGQRRLPDLLSHILVRRTRSHILKWYGYDSETGMPLDVSRYAEYQDGKKRAYVLVGGKHVYFPRRRLETIEYSIEDTYGGLYDELRGYIGKPLKSRLGTRPLNDQLSFARYGLWHYVVKGKQDKEPYASFKKAGTNLSGLIRILLFKRFESSVFAFRETVAKLLTVHARFREALMRGIIPAGDEAQSILYEPNNAEEEDLEALMNSLARASGKYDAADFHMERLLSHVEHDIVLLKKMLALVEPITADKDAKLQTLLRRLGEAPFTDGKVLLFTQYADTARYLYNHLNPDGKRTDVDVIMSGSKNKARLVGRFSPRSNPEYQFSPGESELNMVVATDVLSEGLNLQDCQVIINYDLHWNPVRLIQRFGRIDRIGSEHDTIYAYNFLPERGIERNLKLQEKLKLRIQEIHDTIGEDAQILDRTEQLNPDAMYAIYEQKTGQLNMFEDLEDEFLDLNEAEEIMRQLRADNPAEYERIANLRDGIRTGMASTQKGVYVFCQAGRYQQLFLVNSAGEVVSRDIPRILGTIKCSPQTKGVAPRDGYNAAVMRVQRMFSEEVKHRHAEKSFTLGLRPAQKYVLRELRAQFGVTESEDEKAIINLLEKAFRGWVTEAANKELNLLRKNGVTDSDLLKSLMHIYRQHDMGAQIDRLERQAEEIEAPRIVCSEALL